MKADERRAGVGGEGDDDEGGQAVLGAPALLEDDVADSAAAAIHKLGLGPTVGCQHHGGAPGHGQQDRQLALVPRGVPGGGVVVEGLEQREWGSQCAAAPPG